MPFTEFVGLSGGKMFALVALGTGTVLATEIGDPTLMPWATLGVGGAMACVIFYFYRKLAEEHAKREKEIADQYRVQAALLIVTLQENSKVTAQLTGVVADLRTVVSDSSQELRQRYEQDLRDGGRRAYDPPVDGHKK